MNKKIGNINIDIYLIPKYLSFFYKCGEGWEYPNNYPELEDSSYKYLIKMPMDSVSEENVQKLLSEKAKLEEELNILRNTTPEQMWLQELSELEVAYDEYRRERIAMLSDEVVSASTAPQGKKKAVRKVVKKGSL